MTNIWKFVLKERNTVLQYLQPTTGTMLLITKIWIISAKTNLINILNMHLIKYCQKQTRFKKKGI